MHVRTIDYKLVINLLLSTGSVNRLSAVQYSLARSAVVKHWRACRSKFSVVCI